MSTMTTQYDIALDSRTLVSRWSGIDFEVPLPLVQRWTIRRGDVVFSSHHGKRRVLFANRLGNKGETMWLELEPTLDGNGQPSKDARGIAQMMRVNLFRPVHVKTLASQNRRALLTARKLLQEKAIAIENDIRGLLRNFGLKVGIIGKVRFEDRIRELVAGLPDLAEVIACLLAARQSLRERFATLHRKVLASVRDDDVCRRLMTIPGVGPVVSLAFSATIDIPARFKNSKAVGPALGLTPVLNQSGESNRIGRVSLCGDAMMRALLYEAAQVLLTRVQKWSWLKAWAMAVARRRGLQKAIVALARRLAVIMHRLWSDGTEFRWTKESAVATA